MQKVAYQCHSTFISATTWKIPATIVAYQCQKGGISMPLYIYFCHRVENSCHHRGIQCQKGGIAMPPYVYFCHLLKLVAKFCGPFGPLALAA
jgi:hypothetical protein